MGYTLVICEKPDVARRISDALSGGSQRSAFVDGTKVFRFDRKGEEFVVCAAQGHLFGVSDPTDERTVYPIFDVEWYSSDLLDDGAGVAKRISAIRKLAAGATRFVNACDFDVEGETIGFNLLRYACGGKEEEALRAKFSALTREDVESAFDSLQSHSGNGLASAGRARHAIDFVWGVNFSRALSQSALGSGHRYRTVSMGRVQGPTLGFLDQREREIREFVPVPHWKVSGIFERSRQRFAAEYVLEKVSSKAAADKIRDDCCGKDGLVTAVGKSSIQVGPPTPFNVGDLQREAYRAFGYTPSKTLQIAERLYLSALISYPRTGSQRLPPSINYHGILRGIGKLSQFSAAVADLQRSELKPVAGPKTDPAHPAIHPTGDTPKRQLDASEANVFDLVVRRFLSALAPSARRELTNVSIKVGEHGFRLSGGRTVYQGWMKYYGRYAGYRDSEIPPLTEGDMLSVVDVAVEEKFVERPPRYNQSSLLEKMEKEEIGTKATRAEIIATLVSRAYASGDMMEVTDLGLSVVDAMARHAPSIIGTDLTRKIERMLAEVESGQGNEADVLRRMVKSVAAQLEVLASSEEAIGKEIDRAIMGTVAKAFVLGRCPICKTGELKVIRSKSTKKRFVGCSNYPTCHASAPLPQKGVIRTTSKQCDHCGWPMVYLAGKGRPWRLCVNPDCPEKNKR
jgi:DNA topoisomerase-1